MIARLIEPGNIDDAVILGNCIVIGANPKNGECQGLGWDPSSGCNLGGLPFEH
ncbi:MAG: hypothetical protein HXS51_12490 [Theionarchaea archaeon]|nr:hypothetical protein [Theionarchaea archaeon]